MKILFFPFADYNACGPRVRIAIIQDELKKNNVQSKVFLPKNKIHYFLRYVNIFKGDILHFQKTSDPITILVMIFAKLFNKKIILDVDMNLYEVNPFKVKLDINFIRKIFRLINRETIKIASFIADKIIVNNPELKKIAKRYNKNVYLLEVGINLKDYKSKEKYEFNKEIIIGWAGNGITHRKNLELLINPLNILAKKYKNITFRIVGALYNKELYNSFKKVKNVKLDFIDEIKWDTKTIVDNIKKFDIAVAPMRSIKVNEAKALYKVREYMALGMPFVTSKLNWCKYFVKDDYNGSLADDNEWAEKLEKLIKSHKLRKKIGMNARKKIEENYSIPTITKQFLRILNEKNKL